MAAAPLDQTHPRALAQDPHYHSRRRPLRPREAMSWCEAKGLDYIFGLSGNAVLDRLVDAATDDIRVRRADGRHWVLRGYAKTRYGAKSWARERGVVARIEASASQDEDMRRGLDIRPTSRQARGFAPD